MKKFIKKIEWSYDYNIVYLLYNERKADQYLHYMNAKWLIKTDDLPF